ncbi:hypothetical protein F5Y19DRAFT_109275 [Xylariaceae sp. FL1651]|nr:hypothetical protein F5Y19DRAFT_109275 [Xylariaceae sp. FL1651]
MFTCKACLKRAIDTLHGHALPKNISASSYILQPIRTIPRPSRSSRTYATVAAPATSTDAIGSTTALDSAKQDDEVVPAVGRSAEWAARKELDYLKDPLHIANRVRKALDKDDFDHAALITRKASKDTKVAVSWNHLIDYQLNKGRLHTALKLYNEMKKRAQQPNVQTFTIIFRGCARSEHPKLAVSEAVKLYQNMLSVGRIKPNTIHLNAVLHVCAKVEDLDSMFTILQSSTEGLRTPNNMTYTTIFNALRAKANKTPSADLTEDEINEGKASAIKRAKAIWEEVIARWWAGSLIIDEELVCAMGRILLMGDYQDAVAVEALIEQTMMIPKEDAESLSLPESGSKRNNTLTSRGESKVLTSTNNRSVTKAPGAPAVTHALPGNNSLSLILASLEKTGRTSKALRYWGMFTKHYGVVPDTNNWTQLLKVFSRGKNSARTVAYLQNIPGNLLTSRHVRTAMNTCLRDNLNRTAFHNATEILGIMQKNLSSPDVQTLRTYLQVAHAYKRSLDKEAQRDYKGTMEKWARQLTVALENLWEPYQVVAKQCTTEASGKINSKKLAQAQDFKAEVVALARKMIAAYDILITGSMVPAAVEQRMKISRNSLNRFVVGHFEDIKKHTAEQAEERGSDVDESAWEREFSDRPM